MKKIQDRSTPHSRKRMTVIIAACILALTLALWGCAPQTTQDASSDDAQAGVAASESEDEVQALGYPNFTDQSSGLFPSTYNNDMLNSGNRGCNSCHEDLWNVMNLKDGYTHILTHVGYDKALTYRDCEPCHRAHRSKCGPYLGDFIHASHYGNQVFMEAGGNCWSCHVTDSDGAQGEYQFKLWDDFVDSDSLGGFVNAADAEDSRWWAESRGFDNGFITEVSTEVDPQMTVTFDQAITDEEDVFIVNNWGPEVTEKDGEPYSFTEVASQNTVSITGVNEPKTFTTEEIEAMPQTEFTSTIACATNGLGGSLLANIPMTGVPMSYIIEQCGGLVDGVDTAVALGADGWNGFGPMTMASTYIEDAYIVTKYYGKELSENDGEMVLVSPGSSGMCNVKHLASIEFSQTGGSAPQIILNKIGVLPYPVNGMWFQEDGLKAKVGEPVTLSGAVYSFNRVVGDLATISFSFDMGVTWQDFDVASEVADFDPHQWVTYSIDWTPQMSGTYQVKVNATDVDGNQFETPITLFVNVEE